MNMAMDRNHSENRHMMMEFLIHSPRIFFGGFIGWVLRNMATQGDFCRHVLSFLVRKIRDVPGLVN